MTITLDVITKVSAALRPLSTDDAIETAMRVVVRRVEEAGLDRRAA